MSEHVAAFADRAHHIVEAGRRIGQSRQVLDLVEGAVERRADQRVHARRDAQVAVFALVLELGDPREQHAGRGHQVATRLDPQRNARVRTLECGESLVKLSEVDRRQFRAIRHAKTATHIDDRNPAEPLAQICQRLRGLRPVRDVEDAAARVGMQTCDFKPERTDEPFELATL